MSELITFVFVDVREVHVNDVVFAFVIIALNASHLFTLLSVLTLNNKLHASHFAHNFFVLFFSLSAPMFILFSS